MAAVRKIPYYSMDGGGIFRGKAWSEHKGSEGAVPLATPQTISLDRLAPGERPPPPAPKPQPASAPLKTIADLRKSKPPVKGPSQPSPEIAEAEDHEKIPEFDLQDIPDAMDNMKWPVSAALARKWFASSSHVYNDQANSEQPIDDTTVTLKWALKFGNVQEKLTDLLKQRVYSERAISGVKPKIVQRVKQKFIDQGSSSLSFDTSNFLGDLRQLHINWEFQFADISTANTLDGLHLTDLTGALGNFNIYAAVGVVAVTAEKYYTYDTEANTKTYCADAVAEITHVYIYIKDNYSFNDKPDGNSQYLGHWNKKGLILSYRAAVSGLIDGKRIHTQMGSSTITETRYNWDYLPPDALGKPVDTRTGLVRKLIEKDVYYPVYNKTYNEWRAKHKRGGDFMVYCQPELYKLASPIKIQLEQLCRPSEPI